MHLFYQWNRVLEYQKQQGVRKTIQKVMTKLKAILFSKKIKEKQEQENKIYEAWIQNNEPDEKQIEEQKSTKFSLQPKISILVPMYHTKERYLEELLQSLLTQTYSNWELCLADGSKQQQEYIQNLMDKDSRIRYQFLNENRGISGNSNAALALATGEYVALLDHDDTLPRFSLYEIVKAINENPEVEFIYTDEDKINEKGTKRMGPHFKPDYAPDLLMSYQYICHFSIIKKELMDKIGGFRSEFDGAQDYDLVFRIVEQTDKIIHISKILYHWRWSMDSTAFNASAKPYAYISAKKAIQSHLDRIGEKAIVEESENLGQYKVRYLVQGMPKVVILVQDKGSLAQLQKCMHSIQKTNYTNYEIIIVSDKEELPEFKNATIYCSKIKPKSCQSILKESTAEYVVFCDSRIQITTKNWLETLLGNCQKKDTGIVGVKIYYSDKKLYHAGIIFGLKEDYGFVNSNEPSKDEGYMSRNNIQQNFLAICNKLYIVSKEDYEKREEFESIEENESMMDQCLQIKKKGKNVVYNPNVEAIFESNKEEKTYGKLSQEFLQKWEEYVKKEDPFFNPNFRKDSLKIEMNPNKIKK